jgi:hypothetical protein
MNKRLMLSILLCFLLILTLYPLLKISTKRQKGAIKLFEKNRAFATILCDPQMI